MRLALLAENLLIVFLGLSCVFWLPGVPIGLLSLLKSICLFGGSGLALLVAVRRIGLRLPNGLIGLGGFFLIIVASASAFLQAETSVVVRWFYSYGIAFTALTTMFMYARAGGNVARIVRGAALVLTPIVILAFLAGALDYQGLLAPAEYGSRTIRENGFASSRAVWSLGLGVLFPLLFTTWYERMRQARHPVWPGLMLGVVTVSTLGSQLLCGGRTGLLASLVSLLLLVWSLGGKRRLILVLAAVAAYVYTKADFLTEQLRLGQGGMVGVRLDDVSSGRIEGYRIAWEAFWQRPFIGHGFGMTKDVTTSGGELAIHNLWLGLMADGGLPLVLSVSLFLAALVWRTLPLLTGRSLLWRAAPVVLISALVCCLLEPAVLFGAFQATSLFWFMAGFARAGLETPVLGPQPAGLLFWPQPHRTEAVQ